MLCQAYEGCVEQTTEQQLLLLLLLSAVPLIHKHTVH
jgi:hypothetical protein